MTPPHARVPNVMGGSAELAMLGQHPRYRQNVAEMPQSEIFVRRTAKNEPVEYER